MKVTTDTCLFGAWVAEEGKKNKIPGETVLDIGAGTGLLSLLYAQKNSLATIDAIEIDKEAYSLINHGAGPTPDRRVALVAG